MNKFEPMMPVEFMPELTGDEFIDRCRIARANLIFAHSDEMKRQVESYTKDLIVNYCTKPKKTLWERLFG